MSDSHTLHASTRKRSGSAALKQMRREGLVPAVLYGAKQENVNLKVEAKGFTELLKRSASDNILVNLAIEGLGGDSRLALIQDVQHDALTGRILHADFHAVRSDEEIHAQVPVEIVGTAVGVKQGGLLEHQVHSLEVFCLPKDLPSSIKADVSGLKMGDAIHVRALELPEGVSIHIDGDVVVAIVTEPKVGGETEEEGPSEPVVTSAREEPADDKDLGED